MFFTYNSIDLSDIRTIIFDQRPIFTDDQTTYLYDEYHIKVHALFNRDLAPTFPPIVDPSQVYAHLMGCLSKPRQQLVFSDANGVVIESPGLAPAFNPLSDAKDGPQPGTLSVKQLTPSTWHIEYEIKTWIYNCCNQNTTVPYIAHRWSESVDIDDQFKSKIVRKGRLSFRADKLATLDATTGGTLLNPDQFRNQILGACPLRPGFLRISSQYTVQEDGLEIGYTITDQEQYAIPLSGPPGGGAVKFEAEYTTVTQKTAVVTEEMTVRVWGANTTPKANLFTIAGRILSSRIKLPPIIVIGQTPLIKGARWKDYLHDNYVEVTVSTQVRAWADTFYGMQLGAVAPAAGNQIDPPGTYSNRKDQLPDPGSRGSAGLTLAVAVLQDPCLGVPMQKQFAAQPSTPTETGQGLGTLEVSSVPVLPNSVTLYNPPELNMGSYIKSFIDIDYQEDLHTLQMPVASSTTELASFAVVAQPTVKKIVTYTIEKSGDQPTLPAPESSDPNEVLLWQSIMPAVLDLEADGLNQTWKVSGKYIYGIIDPSLVKVMAGRQPYVVAPFSSTEIQSSKFVSGLTSPDGSSGLTGYIGMLP